MWLLFLAKIKLILLVYVPWLVTSCTSILQILVMSFHPVIPAPLSPSLSSPTVFFLEWRSALTALFLIWKLSLILTGLPELSGQSHVSSAQTPPTCPYKELLFVGHGELCEFICFCLFYCLFFCLYCEVLLLPLSPQISDFNKHRRMLTCDFNFTFFDWSHWSRHWE